MPIRINITTIEKSLVSLSSWFDIPKDSIIQYVSNYKYICQIGDFYKYFRIDERDITHSEIELVSLHVTTNNDMCKSINKYGLLNLQGAILEDTCFSRFLNTVGVTIDIDSRQILYNGKTLSLSPKEYAVPRTKDWYMNSVVRKLYRDYQINGFLYCKNVLNYLGGTRFVPEFIRSLSCLLDGENITREWINSGTHPYILEYYAYIQEFETYMFEKTQDEFKYLSVHESEMAKIDWVIVSALNVIHKMFDTPSGDIHSYAKFETVIPRDRITIYREDEYMANFPIELD